jgi:trehalose 6-phosphate phosphatase
MQYLLSQASRSILKSLAQERTLYAFDFDGTLSPIAKHPGMAGMREKTRILLSRLAAQYPCVIVSGRARADLLGKLGSVQVTRAIGNHGAETEAAERTPRRRAPQSKRSLELELASLPGVWVEDKGLSLTLHYRQSQKAEARRRILAATRDLKQVRVFGGKQVVNVVPDKAPTRSSAGRRTRSPECNWVLYVGDDENDEDAFALEGNIVPVRIGRKRRSCARYYLRTQAEIDELLELLVLLGEAVKPSSGSSRLRTSLNGPLCAAGKGS